MDKNLLRKLKDMASCQEPEMRLLARNIFWRHDPTFDEYKYIGGLALVTEEDFRLAIPMVLKQLEERGDYDILRIASIIRQKVMREVICKNLKDES